MPSLVVVVSGGMDSVTLAHYAKHSYPNYDINLISFDYGQRHSKELDFAAQCAKDIEAADHKIVDLKSITQLVGASSLTSDQEVPDGHYAEESMKQTVVPNRNMIMLAIAAGWAVTLGADMVLTGVHAGDHFIYPDCRPEFIGAVNNAIVTATEGFSSWGDRAVFAPFVHISKSKIVEIGVPIGVDYSHTWSCYKGGDIHCGRCGTCVERKEAFREAGITDPTIYADAEFEIPAYQ